MTHLINYENLINLVRTAQTEKLRNYELICTISTVLEKFEGKPISKRMATAVEKVLPLNTVYWDKTDYHANITIWGNEIHYDKRLTVYLPFSMFNKEENLSFSHSKFKEDNRCHFLEKGRYEETEENLPKLRGAVNQFNKMIEESQTLQKDFPHWPLTYLFEIEIMRPVTHKNPLNEVFDYVSK